MYMQPWHHSYSNFPVNCNRKMLMHLWWLELTKSFNCYSICSLCSWPLRAMYLQKALGCHWCHNHTPTHFSTHWNSLVFIVHQKLVCSAYPNTDTLFGVLCTPKCNWHTLNLVLSISLHHLTILLTVKNFVNAHMHSYSYFYLLSVWHWCNLLFLYLRIMRVFSQQLGSVTTVA